MRHKDALWYIYAHSASIYQNDTTYFIGVYSVAIRHDDTLCFFYVHSTSTYHADTTRIIDPYNQAPFV